MPQLNLHARNLSHRSVSVLLAAAIVALVPAMLCGDEPSSAPRKIGGVYPDLTTYGIYSQDGGHFLGGHNECGIGAVVPWAGKLWMVNYAPHQPSGSEHKLFSIDDRMRLSVHSESVGGTPAGRLIHRESNQLFIAHYAIDSTGNVRAISPSKMPARVTAYARHLTDPANMVYLIDMEGMVYEINVHTLDFKLLFKKPVPGWHGKGGYTSGGRLVISNNGEKKAGSYAPLLVGGPPTNPEEAGVLAEYDGTNWRIVERRQFTDVTGPGGISGNTDEDDRLWAIGWDRRSLRLKLLQDGRWSTYLLPKATLNNDAIHGWYTEWPRIRQITGQRWMMDMHGMFFDFPKSFSQTNSRGVRPIASHLRYVPDFCDWNGRLVIATDETSIQGNHLAGQPQSNLWFGDYEDLKTWGPASGYGGPWLGDRITADTPSDPYLVAGFDHQTVHFNLGKPFAAARTHTNVTRTADEQSIDHLPEHLAALPSVAVPRGDWRTKADGYHFNAATPVTVFLAVDRRGNTKLSQEWKRTSDKIVWGGRNFSDDLYVRDFEPGVITIPANETEHTKGAFGVPHLAFVATKFSNLNTDDLNVTIRPGAPFETTAANKPADAIVTMEIDSEGDGVWEPLTKITLQSDAYTSITLPRDLNATWIRFRSDRDCTATAFLHQTAATFTPADPELFGVLADVADFPAGQESNVTANYLGGLVYAAKRNRNLRYLADGGTGFEFGKQSFDFSSDEFDEKLHRLLDVDTEFEVDAASVYVDYMGTRYRLPKGEDAFDQLIGDDGLRVVREVESERTLANIHGTFYEIPLIVNGRPPAFNQMRPVASHSKRIRDFCSWNGLLVLTGLTSTAEPGEHVYLSPDRTAGVWLGGIDDLWKLGKPTGNGGPWLDTAVKSNQPSDQYLMTGYDQKSLQVIADRNCNVTIEVDFDRQTGFHAYKTLNVTAGQPNSFKFPAGYSAHWVRFVSDTDCTATAQLSYR